MEQSSIRTYRLRGSRITGPQQSALDKYWDAYGIEYSTEFLNITSLFPTAEQVVLEIGFGMGEATALIARDFPNTGFLAVEVHKPGIGKLMARVEELALSNIRIIEGDAHPIITTMIPDKSVDGVHLFFPDPWPKKRHNKRRIVNAEFLALIHPKIKDGGFFHIATDWVPYAEYIEEVFAASPLFTGGVVERPEWRPVTRFEGQGITKDHQVTDLRYTKS
jgi:tRNA (guanine-N7-)-methyltransferase|uniref:tRNA (guanosine(46)-N7)-methyltransferase TrmB n=1 Tax=Candidatus Planktophila sp. TaxID=2175601 RepID=UPI004049C2D7